VVKRPSGKPLVKAGIMAEGEALVVAENLAATIVGDEPRATFDGRGGCFLEVGGGHAVEVAGEFYARPDPRVSVGTPSAAALEKKRTFEAERLRRWFGPTL
ncbi:MAG: NAD(P)/FAD-dependent oxidoreductase, partial [Methanobacteriota archaeon]